MLVGPRYGPQVPTECRPRKKPHVRGCSLYPSKHTAGGWLLILGFHVCIGISTRPSGELHVIKKTHVKRKRITLAEIYSIVTHMNRYRQQAMNESIKRSFCVRRRLNEIKELDAVVMNGYRKKIDQTTPNKQQESSLY